jgi:hypothetical protein
MKKRRKETTYHRLATDSPPEWASFTGSSGQILGMAGDKDREGSQGLGSCRHEYEQRDEEEGAA